LSKIFEALRRTESKIGQLAMPDLTAELAELDVSNGNGKAEKEELLSAPTLSAPPPTPNTPTGHHRAGDGIRSQRIRLLAGSPILFDGINPQAAEQYRIIRTKIHHHPAQPRILMVSSAMPGDGKTISSVNLAGALALQEDLQVLLIDADFRRSTVAKLIGLKASPGLSEVLSGTASIEEALVRVEQFPNLYVLPAGEFIPNATEALTSQRWRDLCDSFRTQFRYTILDSPPLGTVADCDLLQLVADGLILVVRSGHTDRQLLKRAFETAPKAKPLGVILNCAEDWFLWRTHSNYYYGKSEMGS
jgi:capsular exopolysaccharide synthesis family protein